jgi:hypothetical protein
MRRMNTRGVVTAESGRLDIVPAGRIVLFEYSASTHSATAAPGGAHRSLPR